MKKLLAILLTSGVVLGTATAVYAEDGSGSGSQQTISGETTADIQVNGTLGADNTDPNANIPEGDTNWINVTVPTKTIFYNTVANHTISAPSYTILNNSGRPVTVTANGFKAEGTNPTLPNDFTLKLAVTGTASNTATTASTNLITDGTVVSSLNAPLITLANVKNQQQASDTPATPVNNKATFTYTGSATTTTQVNVNYTLNLKFNAVSWN